MSHLEDEVIWLSSCFSMKGSHLRVTSCLLLPAIQLVVGISQPSWVSLPFFIGSCVGVVDWSLTGNFLGLFRWFILISLYIAEWWFYAYLPFAYPSTLVAHYVYWWFWRWWRPLQLYACFNILLLYVYQIPINFPHMFQLVFDFVGLFRVSATSEWTNICSSISLLLFYILVCTLVSALSS